MKDKILIFGGTTEGRELAKCLQNAGILHTVSVATEYGGEILQGAGENDLLVGRKSSKEIVEVIKSGGFSIVVDATHPFATAVTAEIKRACEDMRVTYLRLSRNTGETDLGGELTKYVDSIDDAITELNGISGNKLLLTGSKDLKTIVEGLGNSETVYARVLPNEDSIKKCSEAGLSGKQIIAMQGPFSKEMNKALIMEIDAAIILTKESGKTGGFFEKLKAAEECGIRAVVIRNPESLEVKEDHYELKDIVRKIAELTGISEDVFGCKGSEASLMSTAKKKIALAGIGPGNESYLTLECRSALDNADIIFGAESVVARLSDRGVTTVPKYKGEEILEYLRDNSGYENPVVVYSGDISLCSGARSATKVFADNGYEVRRISGMSSVSLFAGKLSLALEDIRIVAAHGRKCNVNGFVNKESQLIILPSSVPHAAEICRGILAAREGQAKLSSAEIDIKIGYELGTTNERIFEIKTLDDVRIFAETKSGKCLIYVNNRNFSDMPVICGLFDDEIIRGKVPMTKEEIRALSMRRLALTPDAVFYDVGAGTGSISLEAAMTAPGIKVFSIEKKEDAVSLLKENRNRFSVSNMEIVEGVAPDAFANLPVPTHAFIGGSSGNMREIMDVILNKNEYVRIVVNCVTLETFSELMQIIDDLKKKDDGYVADIIQASITRFKKAGSYHLSDALNPVYIASIYKEKTNE